MSGVGSDPPGAGGYRMFPFVNEIMPRVMWRKSRGRGIASLIDWAAFSRLLGFRGLVSAEFEAIS